MEKLIKGKVWKFGDNIDTDVIIPAPYLNLTEPEKLREHLFEPIRPGFSKSVRDGDIIVAGVNFGCGSSREHAPISIKAAGISCIIAKSFARIFYRNSFNIGLPLVICAQAVEETDEGDEIEVNLGKGKIKNTTKGKEFKFKKFDPFILKLVEAGGLIPLLKSGKFK